MRKLLLVIAASGVLASCATRVLEGYVGQPVQVAIAQRGPPTFMFDMPDGRRAFQWEVKSSYVTPRQTYGNANLYAPPGAYSATVNYNQTSYGGQVVNSRCLYTMYARWNAAQNAWIFESFEQPSLMCS